MYRRIEVRDLVQAPRHKNVISADRSEKYPHRYVKWLLANYCWNHGLEFYTEAVFKDGRADFVIADWKLAFEILWTEKVSEMQHKIEKYPLPFIPISVEVLWHEEKIEEMLDDLADTQGGGWEYYARKAGLEV